MQLNLLFPTIVGEFNINRPFTAQEIEFVKGQDTVPNKLNSISRNQKILNFDAFAEVRTFIDQCVAEYFLTVYKPMYDVKMRVTQSWLNYTNTNQAHHGHAHPNSFLSGVFYIQTDDATDKIHFSTSAYRQLQVATNEYDLYNSHTWWIAATTGKLVLFPSQLMHYVEPVVADNTRISLSFNTFPVGQLGVVDETTDVVL